MEWQWSSLPAVTLNELTVFVSLANLQSVAQLITVTSALISTG